MLIFVVLAVLAAGGAGYYFKVYRTKQVHEDYDEGGEYEKSPRRNTTTARPGTRMERQTPMKAVATSEFHRQPAGTADEGDPRPVPESRPKPRRGSLCASCPYWNGTACVGFCYRLLKIQRTSGQVGPKSGD